MYCWNGIQRRYGLVAVFSHLHCRLPGRFIWILKTYASNNYGVPSIQVPRTEKMALHNSINFELETRVIKTSSRVSYACFWCSLPGPIWSLCSDSQNSNYAEFSVIQAAQHQQNYVGGRAVDVGTEHHQSEKSHNNLLRMVLWHLGASNEYNDLYKRGPKRKSGQAGSLYHGYLGMLT